jgi:Predicted ATPases of PP-loop superfamily
VISVVLSWSGGKDSMLALGELRLSQRYEIAGLLTVVTREYDRISIHGVRRELLESQAAALGLPLTVIRIPAGAGNDEYEAGMHRVLSEMAMRGVETIAFGDLFLSDVRHYREKLAARAGLTTIFPIWGRNTAEIAEEFIGGGYQAVITCVDTYAISGDFAGRAYDSRLLHDLPDLVDPCGENGEFHTFVTAGPTMSAAVAVETGERLLRDERFMFCDLLPG